MPVNIIGIIIRGPTCEMKDKLNKFIFMYLEWKLWNFVTR
jgi:hypothetical protein